MMMTMLTIVLSVLIVQVWSKSVTVNTTSGRLLGTHAHGGVYPLAFVVLFTSSNPLY